MNQHTSSFSGASGAVYSYDVYSRGFKPKDNQYYNYMFAGLSAEGDWFPVFIGQGDLLQYLNDQIRAGGVEEMRYTYVLAHTSPDEQQRRMEALDMLASHPQAHAAASAPPAGASHGNPSSAFGKAAADNKPAHRAYPEDAALKSFPTSPQSQDTVWARLRPKI